MVVLRAIGGFFARIGRWIKETAWIQPLLIVGAIFAIIFAIPHIINGVKGWFDESDSANKFFAKYQLSLKNANVTPDGKSSGGSSKVDEFFTYLEEGNDAKVKKDYGNKFFVAFVQKDSANCKDLYGGLKTFKEKWSSKNSEFSGLDEKFALYTIYTDSTVEVDDEDVNLFDKVWINHYDLFETMAAGGYLDTTYYAINKDYSASNYESNFLSEGSESCPISTPLVMFFDFTENNQFDAEDQKVKGLSDIIFTVDGSSDLERARTLKKCWSHSDVFGEIVQK